MLKKTGVEMLSYLDYPPEKKDENLEGRVQEIFHEIGLKPVMHITSHTLLIRLISSMGL